MNLSLTGPSLAVQTCARRLRAFGAAQPVVEHAQDGGQTLSARLGPADDEALTATISWHGPAAALAARPAATEMTVQARSGLMEVHGRDAGHPCRLGLEVASVASGVLASQAVLAALVGRARGRPAATIETSVLEAALVLTGHYIAAATCDAEQWSPPASGPDPGPPFQSADGRWFEIETLEPAAWKQFWSRLDAADADLGRAWTAFRARYFQGRCSLPTGLQQATARRSLRDLAEIAAECRVSLSAVRHPDEVVADPAPSDGHPRIEPRTDLLARLPAAPADTAAGAPLAGVEVVEATSRMQGPLAGLLLQMLGAHVLRVEPPGGDPIRLVAPYADGEGYFFQTFNRGKDAVELDLTTRAGRAALLELAGGADVFLHNWRPGKAGEWGADAETLAARNPQLTYVRASGWGDLKAHRRVVGTDFLVQAYAGIGYGLHPDGEPPAPSRVLLTDCLGALVTCEGALGGLLARAATGRGCRVDASLLAGGMTLQSHVLEALAAGRENGRRNGRPVWRATDRPLATSDGFIAIDAADDDAFAALCRVAGVDPAAGSAQQSEAAIAGRIAAATSLTWERELGAAGVPCAAVCTDLSALARDPGLDSLFEPIGEACRAPAAPWRFAP